MLKKGAIAVAMKMSSGFFKVMSMDKSFVLKGKKKKFESKTIDLIAGDLHTALAEMGLTEFVLIEDRKTKHFKLK
tara:strand:+ start:210 stop:434 length:225 start_codon:yes stop_codon:yes gene_type:complete